MHDNTCIAIQKLELDDQMDWKIYEEAVGWRQVMSWITMISKISFWKIFCKKDYNLFKF